MQSMEASWVDIEKKFQAASYTWRILLKVYTLLKKAWEVRDGGSMKFWWMIG